MAKISLKGLYAIASMNILVKKYSDKTPVKIKEIASLSNTPQNFLEQILNELKKCSLVKSIRGAKGGYMLAKDPKDITVYDILLCVEGDFFDVECKTKNRAMELFWFDFKEHMKLFLSKNLLELQKYEEKASKQNMFYI